MTEGLEKSIIRLIAVNRVFQPRYNVTVCCVAVKHPPCVLYKAHTCIRLNTILFIYSLKHVLWVWCRLEIIPLETSVS